MDEGPEHGHRFTFVVTSQGSYGVVGQEGYKDADWESPPWRLTVRAWSLSAAVRKMLELPLSAWDMGPDDTAVSADSSPEKSEPTEPTGWPGSM